MNKNPYDVLGVSQNASDDEVKKALEKAVREMEGNCYPVITIDKGYSGV